MKHALILVSIIFTIQSVVFSEVNQTTVQKTIVQEAIQEDSYPIPGSHLLREKEQIIYQNILDMGDQYRKPLPKPNDWGFTKGSTQEWWADELTDDGVQYKVPSTCRAVGTSCYIFVEDAIWETRVDQTSADAIATEFDNNIYPTDTSTFGAPPNVDGDEKIIILILDIQDGYEGSGGYVAGYFYSANE